MKNKILDTKDNTRERVCPPRLDCLNQDFVTMNLQGSRLSFLFMWLKCLFLAACIRVARPVTVLSTAGTWHSLLQTPPPLLPALLSVLEFSSKFWRQENKQPYVRLTGAALQVAAPTSPPLHSPATNINIMKHHHHCHHSKLFRSENIWLVRNVPGFRQFQVSQFCYSFHDNY